MSHKPQLASDKNFNQHSRSGRLGHAGLNTVLQYNSFVVYCTGPTEY